MLHDFLHAIESVIDDCENFLQERAHSCVTFVEVLEAKESKLPILAQEPGACGELAKARLAGHDIDLPEYWKACLRESIIDDIEEMESYAKNDGKLLAAASIADAIGNKSLAKRARGLLYTVPVFES